VSRCCNESSINLDDEELIKKSDDMVQDNTKISELEVHLPPAGVSWLPSPLLTKMTTTRQQDTGVEWHWSSSCF
jgi:hypothetical protein